MSSSKIKTWISMLTLFICILLAVEGSKEKCELKVRKDIIQTWWQSSSFTHQSSTYCFNSAKINNPQYMHTKQGNLPNITDAGFHWFVVKLKEPELIVSVTLKARSLINDEEVKLGDDLNARQADMEIWTSRADLDFGSDHCNTRNISPAFSHAQASAIWKFCGKTPTNVSSGETLTVPCMRNKVRMILLRKYVANESVPVRQCMNFVDMWINLTNVTTVFKPKEIAKENSVEQNSRLTIACVADCSVNDLDIKVTQGQNRNLVMGNQTHRISHVQPSDAGNYTCSADGDVLSFQYLRVLYPPSNLNIEVVESCPQGESPGKLNFLFSSSISDPQPEHYCSAIDSDGRNFTVIKHPVERTLSQDKSLTSKWTCNNCCQISNDFNFTLECRAVQSGVSWHSASTKLILESKFVPEINAAQIAVPVLAITAAGIGAAAFLLVILFIKLSKKKSSVRKSRQIKATLNNVTPPNKCNKFSDVTPGVTCKGAISLEPLQANTSAVEAYVSCQGYYGYDTNDCIYSAVESKADGKFQQEIVEDAGASSRPESCSTEYLEITADGN